jgi:hypothetical protein
LNEIDWIDFASVQFDTYQSKQNAISIVYSIQSIFPSIASSSGGCVAALKVDQTIVSIEKIRIMIGLQNLAVINYMNDSVFFEIPPLNAGTYNVAVNHRGSVSTGSTAQLTIVNILVQSTYIGNGSNLFIEGQGFVHAYLYECQFGSRSFPAVYLNPNLLSCSCPEETFGPNVSFAMHLADCPASYSSRIPQHKSTFEFRILQTILVMGQTNVIIFWYNGECQHPCKLSSDFATLGSISWKDKSFEVLSVVNNSSYVRIFMHSGDEILSFKVRLLQKPVIIRTLPSDVVYRGLTQSIEIQLDDNEVMIELATHCVFGTEDLHIINRGKNYIECRAPYRIGLGSLNIAFGEFNELIHVSMLSVVSRPIIRVVEPSRVVFGEK